MITQILQIKQLKSERAERALQRQQHLLTQENSRLNQANQEIVDYTNWRENEEDQLFAQAKDSCLKLKELEELQQHIAILHEKEARLKLESAEIELNRDNEKDILKQRQKDVLHANKAVEKINILKQQDDIELQYQAEYQEEIEQEDRRTISTGECPC